MTASRPPAFSPSAAPVCVPDERSSALPSRAGLGLKPEHFEHVLQTRPDVGFFEVHAENYLVAGGPMHHYLTRIRELYPLSIHGVGLSIGGDAYATHGTWAAVLLYLMVHGPGKLSIDAWLAKRCA